MNGLQARILLDSNGQDLAIEHVQDVEPILDYCKAMRAEEQRSDWGRHIAEIPNVIISKWLDEEYRRGNDTLRYGSREFDELIARKLKDPEYAYLRTDKPTLFTGWMGFGS